MVNLSTSHIFINQYDFINFFLISKYIIKKLLTKFKLINKVRIALKYINNRKNILFICKIMELSSKNTYLNNLFKPYDIINITNIRIILKKINLKNTITAIGKCIDSSCVIQYNLNGNFAPIADFNLSKYKAEYIKNTNALIKKVYLADTSYNSSKILHTWKQNIISAA